MSKPGMMTEVKNKERSPKKRANSFDNCHCVALTLGLLGYRCAFGRLSVEVIHNYSSPPFCCL